jgi:hypothetical protein
MNPVNTEADRNTLTFSVEQLEERLEMCPPDQYLVVTPIGNFCYGCRIG